MTKTKKPKKPLHWWRTTNRWVAPYFLLQRSETREPDERFEGGYRYRRFGATTNLALLNVQSKDVYLYVSFFNQDGGVLFHIEGTLKPRQSDQIDMLRNPMGLGIQPVGDVTSLDYHWEKSGWFQVYASADLQLSAWLQFSAKSMAETSFHNWMLPLAIYPSSDVYKEWIKKVPGRPSETWK